MDVSSENVCTHMHYIKLKYFLGKKAGFISSFGNLQEKCVCVCAYTCTHYILKHEMLFKKKKQVFHKLVLK